MNVGILGAGQLAQMLLLESKKTSLELSLYAGDLKDQHGLTEFLSNVELALFENEFVDVDILKQAAPSNMEFIPSLDCIRRTQNKLSQKQIFRDLELPTARWMEASPKESLPEFLKRASKEFQGRVVLKWAMGGYDGKGTFAWSGDEVSESLKTFWSEAQMRQVDVYAEEWISFRRELAMIGIFSRNQEFTHYPLVISEQKNNICSWVYGPARAFGAESSLEEQAVEILNRLCRELSLYGAFGVEFFETEQGLLINEMAPRVHNSGHFSLTASKASQFENHLRAVCGQGPASTESTPFFMMKNLLGPEGLNVSNAQPPACPPSIALMWYQKEECRPGRKMGHLNAIATTRQEFEERKSEIESIESSWIDQLQRMAS